MLLFSSYILCCFVGIQLVTAALPPLEYKIRNAPGFSTAETVDIIRRELSAAKLSTRNKDLRGNATLDRSWNEAVLLKFGVEKAVGQTNQSETTLSAEVEIVCSQCYLKGIAFAEISFAEEFNASQAIGRTMDQVRGKVENFTEMVDDYFVNYTKGVIKKLGDGIDVDDFEFPTFPFNFALEIPSVPDVNLKFRFDGTELYIKTNTVLSVGATYELNLYSSTTPVGIAITKDLKLGVIFAIDLILSAKGQINISSGFHIKLKDGLELKIAIFSDKISDLIFNGGQFEFLPVEIESGGIVFSAILRIGVHAGFKLVTPTLPDIPAINEVQVGGGIEVGVYANVAEFTTNVTYVPNDKECELKVVQSYQLALGAVAGATVQIGGNTWGPVPETSIPIWYTQLRSLCAMKTKAAPNPTITARNIRARQEGFTTTTRVTKVTYTGVSCSSQGIVNCPASLQITSQSTETKTLTASVRSGEKVTWAQATVNAVATTVAFGSNAQSISATTGKPVSYIPPPPSPSTTVRSKSSAGVIVVEGQVGGVSKKVIVGVSVGVGVPVLIALAAGIFLLLRRSKGRITPSSESVPMIAEPYESKSQAPYSDKPKTGANVREVEQH
ncbi:hypothetical protein B0J11DRAFT_564785 [Dendryphion nanum]|uniref:Mid2 domain-containing protein n=1 Tax=Dendryphion nanum TaxID=256645 RepID=A0A9P9EBR8_9PLEO|nr:hypothetical protein B0J11DRAFT_564785 [Dendryphion nanum]